MYVYIRNQVTSFLMLVECKKFAPRRLVTVEKVQRLYGVQQASKAQNSMLVTTSDFTGPSKAQALSYEHAMSIKAFDDIKAWLNRYR